MGGSEDLSATRQAEERAGSPPGVPLCLAPWRSSFRPGHLSQRLQAQGCRVCWVHTAGHQGLAEDLGAECAPFPGAKPHLNLCANT